MKRLISGAEAVQAGLMPRFPYLERVTPAVERMPSADTYCLWRSLPGYRKACRMLRRSGRRIRRGEAISSAHYHGLDLARGPDDVVVSSYMGIDLATCPPWRSDARESTVASIIQDIESMRLAANSAEATPFRGMDALPMAVDYGTRPDEAWLISGSHVGQMVHVVNLEKAKG